MGRQLAEQLGVTELLLPLVVFGRSQITSTSDGELGRYELDSRIAAAMPEFMAHAEGLTHNLNALAEIVSPHAQRIQGASPEVIRGVAADLATDIEETALDIQRAGADMETVISAVDADIRRYHALVMGFGSDEMKPRCAVRSHRSRTSSPSSAT